MFRRISLYICFVFAWTVLGFGQGSTIDSLNLKLANASGVEKARVLYLLASEYIEINPELATGFLNEAQSIIDQTYNDEVQAYIWKYRSSLDDLISYGSGIEYLRKAIELFQVTNNYHETGWCCRRMAILFFHKGDFERATYYFLTSQRAFEKEQNLPGMEAVENGLGVVQYSLQNYDEAFRHYKRALELNKKTGDSVSYYKTISNLGLVYFEREVYDTVLIYFNEAQEGFLKRDNFTGLSTTFNNIALSYYNNKNFSTALEYQRKALSFAKEINSDYSIATSYVNLGAIFTDLRQADSALYYLKKSRLLSDSLAFRDIYQDALTESARTYASIGNYKQAYNYQLEASELNKEMTGNEVMTKIAELSVGYQQEISEGEFDRMRSQQDLQSILIKIFILLLILIIVIFLLTMVNLQAKKKTNQILTEKNDELNLINSQLSKSEEELKQLNRSKDRLFSIVAHDLRNPIAAVSGFSELLSSDFDQLDDDMRKEYLLQIIQGVQRTQTLLENLLIWSRSQMKAVRYQPDLHPVCSILDESVKPLKLNFEQKKLRLITDCKRNFDVYADRDMVLTIIRNLLINAVKFSFPGGVVELSVDCDEHNCHISIEDHGIGIQPELQEKLLDKSNMVHSTPGTSGEAGSGLGLAICLEFAELNHGKIILDSVPGKGSVFTLVLPLDITST